MAVRNNYGFTFVDKNRVRRLHEAGKPIDQIAAALRCTTDLVSRYLRTQSKGKAEPVVQETPTAEDADEFGPLPDSKEWADLTPGQKGQISKRRNAA